MTKEFQRHKFQDLLTRHALTGSTIAVRPRPAETAGPTAPGERGIEVRGMFIGTLWVM